MIKKMLNPFEKYTENKLLVFGLVCLIIGSYIGYLFNAYFDSILHISFIKNSGFIATLIQNVIIAILLVIVLYALGKYINPKTRFVDVLNVSLIARIPFYFSSLVNINDSTYILTEKLINNKFSIENIEFSTSDYLVLLFSTTLGLLLIIWFAILLWNGFKTATNAKTTKEIVLLIISLLITNFISSYLIQLLTF
jgi:uncharacterized protein YjeT (DUF2065 family)